MLDKITVASAQFDIKIFEKEKNLETMTRLAVEAVKEKHADLVVFPEAAINGYCFTSREETEKAAILDDGPEIEQLKKLSKDLGASLVFGAVVKRGEKLRNSAFFVEPDGKMFSYDKTHLPFLGMDRFIDPGESIHTFDTRFGKLGIMICYDLRVPEVARVLALEGARLIIHPTNLPVGAEGQYDYLLGARACENRVPIVSCNRSGVERGTSFIGRSQVVACSGKLLTEEAGTEEEIVWATLDLSVSDPKDIVVTPGEYEIRLFKSRQPHLFGALTADLDKDGYPISNH